MRTSQVRRFLLSFALLALLVAPIASADPTWLPMFDDEIVAYAKPGNGTELRIVPYQYGNDLSNAIGESVSYDRLDAVLSDLTGVTSVRTDGGYIAGNDSLEMLENEGLTVETDIESDVSGQDDARTYD